jgi:chaperonin GroEL
LAERIAKLSGGVAIIKVGSTTTTELEDHQRRFEGAKNATFAAIEEGIVPDGVMYVHLWTYVPALKETIEDHDGHLGPTIIQKVTCFDIDLLNGLNYIDIFLGTSW